jgi:hypothetical protein
MLHVEPGAVYAVYVWKVYIVPGTQTAAGYQQVVLRRTTSASTGGSTLVPSALTPFSSLFTGIVRENATGGGADGVTLANASYFVGTTTTVGQASPLVLFDATGLTKRDAIYIPAGGTVGLELHNNTGGAGGANHYACVQFSEEVK